MLEMPIETLDPGGYWDLEHNEAGPFRWTRPRFSVAVPDRRYRYASLRFASPMRGNRVSVRGDHLPLLQGWQSIGVSVDADVLEFELAHEFEAEGDDRKLGLMLRDIVFHDDEALHRRLVERQANAVLNSLEFSSGAETLQSVPTDLRITTSKRCNIANESPCVYCSWDWAKRLEAGSPDFTIDFLRRLGPFIDLATSINDCSYGEPPLEAEFGAVVALATEGGRRFEFTSNGQTLGARNRRKLVGHNAIVHVSIEAASAASYRRYRDHRFELVIANLRALCAEKGGPGALPLVSVSFIVMQSNLAEIDAFIALMKDVGVDRVAFRTLFLEDRLDVRRLEHYGWQFDYDAECLSYEELQALALRCKAAGAAAGMPIVIEWDDFARNSGPEQPGEPICSEPWRTAYVLDRGIMPCCYGRDPMVRWADIDQASLADGVRDALNSEPFRALRRDLAAGRLGQYCLGTQGCPIVKARAGHAPV